MPHYKKVSALLSAEIIVEMGTKKLMQEASISKSTVSQWKTGGMPKYFCLYLRARYPELKVWSKFQVEL